MSRKSNMGLFVAGTLIGIGGGILIAPKSGEEIRNDIKKEFNKSVDKVKSMKFKNIKNELNKKIKELEKEIRNLDKENVFEKAALKVDDIMEKSNDLIDLAAKEENTLFSEMAEELKMKALEVSKNVLENLED